jgi:hypothetical protein
VTDCKPIILRQTEDGRLYAIERWPDRAAISPILFDQGGYVTANGEEVTIKLANGSATYVKVSEGNFGEWICDLCHSGWSPPPVEVSSGMPR